MPGPQFSAPSRNLRTALANEKIALREYAADIETVKLGIREILIAAADGDPKKLGSNEQLREDAYERAYLENRELQRLVASHREYQARVDRVTAELEAELDQAKAQRLEADARRTDAIFACIDVLNVGSLTDGQRSVATGALASTGAA